MSRDFNLSIAQYIVSVKDFGAKGDTVYNPATGAYSGTDDTEAIRAAVNSGRKVFVPQGLYTVTEEIEVATAGQTIEFENVGGFGEGLGAGSSFQFNTAFIVKGTFDKRIRTRRLFRGSSEDPQDAPISCVFNIQANAVRLINPGIVLYCDYSDQSPTNFGDDCDIAIFIGCRYGVQIHDPVIMGYFRRDGICLDVTQGSNFERFRSTKGVPYPSPTPQNGADGLHIHNPRIRGPRRLIAIVGALPKEGASDYGDQYYDEFEDGLLNDTRGSGGASDVEIFGGALQHRHHSNRRMADPTPFGGTLNQTSLEAEDELMPCAYYVDGLASNGANAIQNHRIFGTRMVCAEAFGIRLDRGAGLTMYGCHMEGKVGNKPNTAGELVDTGNFLLHSYGHIAGTSRSGDIHLDAISQNTPADTYPHFYGGSRSARMTRGRWFVGDYLSSDDGKDLRLNASTGQKIRNQVNGATALQVDTNGVQFGASGPKDFYGSGDPKAWLQLWLDRLFVRQMVVQDRVFTSKNLERATSAGWVSDF